MEEMQEVKKRKNQLRSLKISTKINNPLNLKKRTLKRSKLKIQNLNKQRLIKRKPKRKNPNKQKLIKRKPKRKNPNKQKLIKRKPKRKKPNKQKLIKRKPKRKKLKKKHLRIPSLMNLQQKVSQSLKKLQLKRQQNKKNLLLLTIFQLKIPLSQIKLAPILNRPNKMLENSNYIIFYLEMMEFHTKKNNIWVFQIANLLNSLKFQIEILFLHL